jgi:hypothetical protein
MSEKSSVRIRGGSELVQPAAIRLYKDLIKVYRIMRERQKDIDAAFDRVSAQIGFVVTTTLPVRVEVADGTVRKASFDGATLRDTIFEKELSPFLEGLTGKSFSGVAPGTYRFYLIWYEALNLKLRFDWYESAHVLQGVLGSLVSPQRNIEASSLVRPEVMEPPHWFDPGFAIAVEDALVILAIDEVYPELRLVERIQAGRLAVLRFGWGVRPPWHSSEQAPISFSEQLIGREPDLLGKIRAVLGKER